MIANLTALAGVSLLRALLWRKLIAENDLSEGMLENWESLLSSGFRLLV
jgi:hypothetical protein